MNTIFTIYYTIPQSLDLNREEKEIIVSLLRCDHKVTAIKYLKDCKELSLTQAKYAVDTIQEDLLKDTL